MSERIPQGVQKPVDKEKPEVKELELAREGAETPAFDTERGELRGVDIGNA